MTELWDKITVAARNFAVACAVALDLPSDFFASAVKEFNASVVRLNYFEPCPYERGISTGDNLTASIRVGEHTDSECLRFCSMTAQGFR